MGTIDIQYRFGLSTETVHEIDIHLDPTSLNRVVIDSIEDHLDEISYLFSAYHTENYQ